MQKIDKKNKTFLTVSLKNGPAVIAKINISCPYWYLFNFFKNSNKPSMLFHDPVVLFTYFFRLFYNININYEKQKNRHLPT